MRESTRNILIGLLCVSAILMVGKIASYFMIRSVEAQVEMEDKRCLRSGDWNDSDPYCVAISKERNND